MIFFLGPLPPPVHGFSAINQKMLERISERSEVRVFNTSLGARSSGAKPGLLFKVLHWLRQFLSFLLLAIAKRPDTLYVGLSGGMGQVFDSFYILVARLAGAKIFLHHHSFVYVNETKPYNRICLWLAGNACHIALCDVMAEKLSSVFGIPNERIFILSNAAFLNERTQSQFMQRPGRDVLTLGFISNIILEKGIVEFFDVVSSLTQQGFRVKGRIAGPVDPSLQEMFSSMLKEQEEIEHVGPVYDGEKDAFFQSIDMMLFPTKYRNEAEPLIILEALRDGIPVLAADRGCIRSLVSARFGMVFPEIEHFVTDASEYIKSVLNGTNSLDALSQNAFKQFYKLRSIHEARLDALLEKMTATKPSRKPVQA